jgi:hypothetical protein
MIEIPLEFEQEKTSEGALVLQESQKITKVEDESQYIIVCNKAKDAAANINAITAYMQPFVDRAHAAHKRLTTIRGRLLQPFEDAKGKFSGLAFNFQEEQRQARARAEEEERKKALAQQEADRAAQATQLADEGRIDEGLAVLETPVVPFIPATVASMVPKVKGISSAKITYVGEVTNMMEFVKGIVEGKTPITVLKVDQSALDKLCGIYKEATAFPGVKLQKKIGGSIRG